LKKRTKKLLFTGPSLLDEASDSMASQSNSKCYSPGSRGKALAFFAYLISAAW